MDEYDLDAATQHALDRLTLLVDAGSALASTLELGEALRRVCRIVAQRLGGWCAVDVVEEDGRIHRVCVVHGDHGETGDRPWEGHLPPLPARGREPGPLRRVLDGAGPILLHRDALAAARARGEPVDTGRPGPLRGPLADSAVIAPLRARGEIMGALTVARPDPRAPLLDDDVALVADLTHRVALAVDNARLHQQARHVAELLQRSLLPDLPGSDSLRLAARYVPSPAAAEVGGDWYDSFVLPGGATALIIGDVTGHDLHAAIAMSHLRNMLRGIACDRQEPPGAILRRLDIAHSNLLPEDTATCLYGLLEGPPGGPWQFHHASAGHPPPLLITADGDSRYLTGGEGVMLGASPERERGSVIESVPPGATLLLYTDGLIERRTEPLDQGMVRLRRQAAALAGEPLEALCDGLLAALGSGADDDVALLALRLPEA